MAAVKSDSNMVKKSVGGRIRAFVVGFVRDELGFSDTFFASIFLLLLVVYWVPLFAFRYLPMQDMPAHLAVVRVWSEAGSASVLGQSYALRDSYAPYIVGYGMLRALSNLVSLHVAGKIMLIGYAAALPLSVAYTLRSFGRDPRLSLLAFAFIYNRQFVLGFFSSLISIPLLVFSIGFLKRYLDAPTSRREATMAFLLVLLYFTHGLAALGFAIAGPIVFFLHVQRPWLIVRRSLFVLPAFAMFAWWALRSAPGQRVVGEYLPVTTNFTQLGHWAVDVLHASIDDAGLVAIVATLVVCAAMVPARRIRTPKSFAMAAAGVGLLVVFFLVPAHISQPIDHWGTGGRIVVPGFLLLLGLPSIDFRGMRFLLLLPALVVMLLGRAALGDAMADFDRQARPIDDVIAAMPPERRVMCLVYEKEHPAFEASPFWHFLTLYQVVKGGVTSDGLINDSTPVQWRVEPLPSLSPHVAYTQFKYAQMGSAFDYFLVLWPKKMAPQPSFPGAGNHVRLVAQSGRFAAYQNVGSR